MSLLLDIPFGLISVILNEWLELPDIVRFDSACCERERRRELIVDPAPPKPPLTVNKSLLHNHWTSALHWFIFRKISVKNVEFNFEDGLLSMRHVTAFLDVSSASLEDITVKLTEGRSSLLDTTIIITALSERATWLQYLTVNGCALTASALVLLSRLPYLHTLCINVTSHSNSQTISTTDFDAQYPSLYSLSVVGLVQWSPCDMSYVNFLVKNSSVRRLKLARLLDLNVCAILQHCPELYALSLANSRVYIGSMARIGELCPHIEHLDLTGLWVGDREDQVCKLFQLLPLRSLCLNKVLVSDNLIAALATHLRETLCVLYMAAASDYHNSAQFLDTFAKCTNLHTLCMTTSQAAHFSVELGATKAYDRVASISALILIVDGSFETFTPDFYNVTQLSANFHADLKRVLSHSHSTSWLRTEATRSAFVDQLETLSLAGVPREELSAVRALYPHTTVSTVEQSFFEYDVFSVEYIV